MSRRTTVFLSLSVLSVLIVSFFLCSPPNPFVPDNTKIFLALRDSKGVVDINSQVTEAVTDTIWVGVYAYLSIYVDSVSVTINNGLATDTQFTIKKFASDLDTAWRAFSFLTTGTRSVIITPYVSGKKETNIQRNITIIGKPISVGISPRTSTIKADSSVTFVANALGTGPFSYQWYHNDTAISAGGTSQAFAIKPATLANSGTYTCKVKDQWGDSAFSDTAILTVFKPNAKPVLSIVNSRLKIWTTDTSSITISVTDPDSGQIDSISIVKAPQGYTYNNFLFTWVPPAGYLGTDSVRADTVVFAAIDNGTPRAVDTLVAKIEVRIPPVNFSVLYSGNGNTGGTVPTDANAYMPGTSVTVKANTGSLVKTGYTFAGWNTKADGSGTSYAAAATFTIGAANDTLFAKWTLTLTTYTVTYNGNGNTGGTAPSDTSAYAQGAIVTVKANTGTLVKTNYTFTGWNTKADGSGTSYAVGTALTMGTASDTLFAKWTFGIPVITTEPGNSSVVVGQTATFSVVATGVGLQYQWQKGTANLAGDTLASYTTPATTIADNGSTYRCIVSNSAGKDTSVAATLTVTTSVVAPAITTDPANQSVSEGATATFSVVASGTSPQYQWQKGTANITGATSASYTTPVTILATDNGSTYRCIVSNTAGKDTSTAATLTVTAAIVAAKITTQPANQSVAEGATATFSVVASGTSPQYQWQKGTANITGATSASYMTPVTVLATDNGSTYRCIVSNSAGKDTSTAATLTVTAAIVAAKITTEPANQSVSEGATATFSVVASGTSPQYQWQKGTANITGATSASYTTPVTVLATDNGSTYRCIVSNSAGKDTSTAATLTVNAVIVAPVVTTDPTNQSVVEGSTATFSVVASGTSPQYQWQKGTTNIASATSASYTTPATVLATDNGTTYRCIVSNTAGKDTSTAATLTVTIQVIAPVVTADPANQSVCAGQTATFTITATGTSPQYQWQKGTTNVGGATSASYTTAATVVGDNGSTYRCIVSNTAGKDTSTAATLTVNALPSITTQPLTQTVCAGGSVTFSVTATGSGTLSYQWKNGTTAISGATASSYTKTNLATGDAGNYTCDVTSNACTATSSAATLTVTALPAIATQPVSQTVCAGGSVTFSVAATGSGTLSYQWKNGTTIISGATASSYAKTNLAAGDAGSYTCEVTSNTCTITSNAATLAVNALPAISVQPQTQTVCAGDAVTFSVTATGSGTLSYQWKKAGSTIPGATASSYTKSGLAAGDAGNYTCDVTSNTCTVTSSAATLTITALPVITTQPQTQTVCVGDAVAFSVTATGSGTLSYQWKKGGAPIGGATSSSYNISSPAASDAGNYTCDVTSNSCTITSSTASLTVNTPPSITAQPSSATLSKGQSNTLSVTASGSAPLSYQWIKDGLNVPGATGSSYAIPVITEANAATYKGSYTCLVTNGCSSTATSNPAVITIPQYQVTFNNQNGANDLVLLYYKGPIGTLPSNPTYANCNFKGWFTGYTNNGTQLTTTTVINQNTTYYARWSVVDASGYEYKTVRIKDQTWLAENLRTTKFNDGTAIQLISPGDWGNTYVPGYAMYNGSVDSFNIYGALYNFYAITSTLAPTGWHVATDNDWGSLTNRLGIDGAADSLKEAGSAHWGTANIGKNSTGFTALPAGYITGGGSDGIGVEGSWWTSTVSTCNGLWSWDMLSTSSNVTSDCNYSNFLGWSVRCVHD